MFKCCKQSSVDEAAALPIPTAPAEEPIKDEEIAEEAGTEASAEEVDAEDKAATASYACCGVW
eukprot:CAMPEP_0203639788 /NCGR_PEP_ID=MMETSP0088-20131115/5461_1 /ASSEMBLY_ACC=CAM_ASM_001087 /TAXON_ID=426623 /ORGANISM="Chaetoceros affinis, Strain CCMP159" /LENGTH=62 /DNA_ID=CAMNT_0050494781 /DNA_START=63 /DNA_END=251 /DNA_ORIENTATION=+